MKKADKRTFVGKVKLYSVPTGKDIFYTVEGTSGARHPVSAIGAKAAKGAAVGTPFKLYITSNGIVTYYELERI